tara:strand:- start:1298 stop:1900 length:603 start_codon:yes stop_codon:yes gene_type:complete
MCEPTTMFVLGTTMSAAQAIGAQKAGRRAARASREQFLADSERAIETFTRQTLQARERQTQEEEALSNDLNKLFKDSQAKQSTLITSSLEAGVGGQTTELLLQDIQRQEAEYQVESSRSFKYYSDNLDDQLEELRLGTRDRIEDMKSRIVQPPSSLATALQIGTGAINAYASSGLVQENQITDALNAGQAFGAAQSGTQE